MSEVEEISIKIKRTNINTSIDIKIAKESTISELKEIIQEKSGIEPSRQTLVYKGKILVDNKTLNEYSVDNDHSLILVEKAVNTETISSSTSSNPNANPRPFTMQAGLGTPGVINTDLLRQPIGGGNLDINTAMDMMSNPQVQQAMNEMLSNPQVLNAILENPSIKPMLDSNPFMRSMMSNPQFLQTMMNPTFLQSMSGMMNNSGATNQANQNTSESRTSNSISNNSNPFLNNPFQLFSGLPSFNGANNLGNIGNSNNPLVNNLNNDPKEKYKEQNIKLKEMGFIDDEVNIEILIKTGGNVDAAVERLINLFK